MTDGLPIKLSPDDINRYVADQILESALGEALREAIKKEIDEMSTSYRGNPWEHTIKAEIQKEIQRIILSEYPDFIRQKAREFLTEQLTNDFVTRAFEALMKAPDRY